MNKYKYAIIGLGQIGLMYDFDPKRVRPSSHSLAFHLNPSTTFIAASDICQEQEGYLTQIAPSVCFYTNYRDMLKDCKADIISICTPPMGRLELIRDVLELGTPQLIFCEKPVALNISDAIEIISLVNSQSAHFVPNLSRRWNLEIQRIRRYIATNKYGSLEKIFVRYTRGIYNTGSHIFDLLRFLVGNIDSVQVIRKVQTSSDHEEDPSYCFLFTIGDQINGNAEAFNDENYYMFEIDFYFTSGKIELKQSGNEINYYAAGDHPLFTNFKSLELLNSVSDLLQESNLSKAVDHLVQILDEKVKPICKVEDGVYPLFVADALSKSFYKNGSLQKVEFNYE